MVSLSLPPSLAGKKTNFGRVSPEEIGDINQEIRTTSTTADGRLAAPPVARFHTLRNSNKKEEIAEEGRKQWGGRGRPGSGRDKVD